MSHLKANNLKGAGNIATQRTRSHFEPLAGESLSSSLNISDKHGVLLSRRGGRVDPRPALNERGLDAFNPVCAPTTEAARRGGKKKYTNIIKKSNGQCWRLRDSCTRHPGLREGLTSDCCCCRADRAHPRSLIGRREGVLKKKRQKV